MSARSPEPIAGRYEFVRLLGEGASGRTLLCREVEADRQVAVKELRFERLDDWKQLELFEREANVLSRLDHPGVPKVYEFFRGGGDRATLYIVQEFVDGVSLQERIDSGPMLGQTEIEDIARGLLEVLEYLHGRVPPVLHRDIKPANVLVRTDGSVALVDFGGVWAGWRPAGQAGQTVLGTFGYMPPEQLVGQATPASDLYALGATLLHAVTGRSPEDFPFDSGRIEVPTDLPVADGLAGLIEAALRPARRDRPRDAAAALAILDGAGGAADSSLAISAPDAAVGEASSPDTPRAVGREDEALRLLDADSGGGSLGATEPPGAPGLPPIPAPSLPPVPRTGVVAARGFGPRFVDLGPPPRDPKGEFADVYRNLVNPMFPANRTWGLGAHIGWVVMASIFSVVSVGVAPAVYIGQVRERRTMYGDLFTSGGRTRGRILSAEASVVYATFRYEFEVEGVRYTGAMEYAQEMTRFWGVGETVPVLYDPNDPARSCFIYR